MIPDVAALPDVVRSAVHLPVSNAILQEREEEELPPLPSHEVGSPCARCGRKCLFVVQATPFAITGLHQLLISGSLTFLCIHCVRRHGLIRRENGR